MACFILCLADNLLKQGSMQLANMITLVNSHPTTHSSLTYQQRSLLRISSRT